MIMSPLLSNALVVLAGITAANGVSYDLTLAAKKIAPDGFTRSAALVNRQFPAPLLTASKGDSVAINVVNDLADPTMRRSTSIHWHGIFQPRNAYNDGPSFVTQCPIAPGQSYPYSLVLGQQAGTFWYHSHLSTQYVDGIRGPLVIYDPHDPMASMYDVDNEKTVITLADWYHPPALGSTNAWFAGGPEPVPDSGLINGIGRFAGGPQVTRARINVQHGKRYRFRVISLSASGFFEFSIANHSMTVIEADGITHHPYTVDSMPLLPGQRYSVVVMANRTVDNYWISATQTVRGATTSTDNPNFNGTDTFAVLHYEGAPNAEPTAPQPTGLAPGGVEFEEFNLKPLVNPGSPGGANPPNLKVFNFTFGTTAANGDAWTINGIQYKSPSVPTLLNILANGFTNDSQFGPNENTFVLPLNTVIEVNFIGTPGHAFHLHGHAFSVVQSASGGPRNFVDPPRRDVTASGGNSTNPLSIRFLTDNPGPWFIHCHLDFHLAAGLAAVFAEDPKGQRSGPQSIHPNPQWEKLCGIYNKLPADLQ